MFRGAIARTCRVVLSLVVGATALLPVSGAQAAEIQLRETACRLYDSRQIGGLNAGTKISSTTIETQDSDLSAVAFTSGGRSYNMQGGEVDCTVPESAIGAILNVVLYQPDSVGNATIWPAGKTQPLSTSINSSGALNEATGLHVRLGASGQLSLAATITGAHYIIDLSGYLEERPTFPFRGLVVSSQTVGGAVYLFLEGQNTPFSCELPYTDPSICENIEENDEVQGTAHIVHGSFKFVADTVELLVN